MNISNLLEKIDLFREMVVESGFKRDVEAYRTAIQSPETQGNLVALKAITNDLIAWLEKIEQSDLEAEMNNLLPGKTTFLEKKYLEDLHGMVDDPEINTSDFYSQLDGVLSNLEKNVKTDEEAIDELAKIFTKYGQKVEERLAESDKAIMSIIFRDLESIRSLKSFAKALDRWNRTLLIYHQLVSGDSPKDIGLSRSPKGR